jgi:hypothetical protein
VVTAKLASGVGGMKIWRKMAAVAGSQACSLKGRRQQQQRYRAARRFRAAARAYQYHGGTSAAEMQKLCARSALGKLLAALKRKWNDVTGVTGDAAESAAALAVMWRHEKRERKRIIIYRARLSKWRHQEGRSWYWRSRRLTWQLGVRRGYAVEESAQSGRLKKENRRRIAGLRNGGRRQNQAKNARIAGDVAAGKAAAARIETELRSGGSNIDGGARAVRQASRRHKRLARCAYQRIRARSSARR